MGYDKIIQRMVSGMKLFKKTTSLLLSLILVLSVVVPVNAASYSNGYIGAMAGEGRIYAEGLDISYWQQGDIDFADVKNAGYSYVILRCGSTKGKDSCFESFYSQAKAAGLDVGAYYYSYATTVAASETDANNCLSWISGKTFEYPIYFDYEDPSQSSLSTDLSTQICYTFLNKLKTAGYLPGLYSMASLLEQSWVTTSGLRNDYEGWVAHYLNSGIHETLYPTYSTKYGMHQYTNSIYINGKGPYNANVCYKDYPSIVKKYGFNGYPSGKSVKGSLDEVTGKVGSISVRGWAFDEDDTSQTLEVHIYIGGEAGVGEGHIIKADKERTDVNTAYGCGDYHGFDEVIETDLRGEQTVYMYVINTGNGSNVYVSSKTVTIADRSEPIIGDVDGDGNVTITDATLIQKYLVEIETLTEEQSKRADANADGRVDIKDATYIQLYCAGIVKI